MSVFGYSQSIEKLIVRKGSTEGMKKRMNKLVEKLAMAHANTPAMARVKTVVMALAVLVVAGMLTACGQSADNASDTTIAADVDGGAGQTADVETAGGDEAGSGIDDAGDDGTGEDALPTEPLPPLEILPLENIEFSADNAFTCTYDGLSHDVILDMPETVEGASLVIMLPGYGNTAEGFRSTVHLEETLCPAGYMLAYVTGAPDAHSTTASTEWNSGMGLNENKDAEFLVALVEYLEENYKLNSDKTYAVGFSNGAFMTHRIAIEAGDTFEAIVSVAGMMPKAIWEERRQNIDIGVFQITGEKDDVVPKYSDNSAKSNPNPAIEDVVSYYVEANSLSETSKEAIGKSEITKYESETGHSVWNLFVKDGRHSWPTPDIQKIDTNQLILEFLEEN